MGARSKIVAVLRGTPASVWLLTGLFAALGAWWSLIVPVGDAPDEPTHYDLVAHVAESGRYPDYDGRSKSVAALAMQAPGVARTPESATPRADRPGFTVAGGGSPLEWPDPVTGETRPLPNQMPQHPPLYYAATATLLRGVRGVAGHELSIDREVLLLRLLGVAIVSVLPAAAFHTARRLGASTDASTAATATTLVIPQVPHVSGAVSYLPLAIGTCAVLAVLVAGVLTGDARRSTALSIGVVLAAALWTTSSAVFLLPWVMLAYVHLARRGRTTWRTAAAPAVLALTTAGVLGSPWWIRNWLRHGTPTPSTDSDLYASLQPPEGFAPRPWRILELARDRMPVRFFGAFGTEYSAELRPALVVALVCLCVAGVVAASVPRRLVADDGLATSRVLVLGSPMVLVLAFVLYRSWDLFQMSGRVAFLQGRYLFVALVPFVVAVGTGLTRVVGRAATGVVLLVAGIAHVDATRAVLDVWWAEPGASLGRRVRSVGAWNGGFDALPLVVLVLVAALGAGAVAAVLRRPSRFPSRPGGQ